MIPHFRQAYTDTPDQMVFRKMVSR